jgi:phosphoribosyl 1,2-cyclic phosphate phosphodiesterase
MKITFLGTGTSQGVPVIACNCHVCQSDDPKDDRLRTSAMLTLEGKNYVIDAGPDFRQQMLRGNVQSLEAVIFTHEHKDHIAGLDDVRAYNYKQKKDMPVYGSHRVETALHREFHYAFGENPYPGIPRLDFCLIDNELGLLLKGGIISCLFKDLELVILPTLLMPNQSPKNS